jgi:hypothetical protein
MINLSINVLTHLLITMWQKLAEINGPWGCGQGHIYIYIYTPQ